MTESVAASDLQHRTVAPGATDAEPGTIQKIAIHFGQGVPVPEGYTVVSNADAMREATADTFRAMGVDEAVLAQRGQPVSATEYKLAQFKKTSLFQDVAWRERYLNGDVEARRTMATLSIILGSSIKEEPAK